MGSGRPLAQDLLDRADAARRSGQGDVAARLYDRAIDTCRDGGDPAGWVRAVLGAASVHVFGTDPGKLPAQLYDVLVRTTDPADRARLGAALARCWAYAGQAARAARFAGEAVQSAQQLSDPELLADCLDAALAAAWGPDDLQQRIAYAARLDEVAAHTLPPEPRLQAHLWGLQVACESMDVQRMHLHLRALERLGEESPRARFFAASRRLMLELMGGPSAAAPDLIAEATTASEQAGLADSWMVIESMKGYAAARSGDRLTCARIALECERFAVTEGSAAVCSEAAYFWLRAGRDDRARSLALTFSGTALANVPRDVNWLLTMQCVAEVALALPIVDLVADVARLLGPYSGRAVFNAGAVHFHGLVDDTLARAAAVRGDTQAAARLRERALTAYEQLGATWWYERLAAWVPAGAAGLPRRVRLHPTSNGLWLVGAETGAVPVRALRGFTYLQTLLRRPGRRISALDLVTAGTGAVLQPPPDQGLDRQAAAAYRQRLADLDGELDEAHAFADPARLEALKAEREALIGELGRAAGLSGRARMSGSSLERSRVAATKAIGSAVNRIGEVDPALGGHLRETVHTGLYCSYDPDPGAQPEWILDR